MGNDNEIQISFDSTLKDSNLENLTTDAGELIIDSLFGDGILKEIPIVSTIVGFAKFGANIRDRLFLKKILTFLSQFKNIPPDQRRRMVQGIDDSKKHRVKVGEKILYIIDACHDHETSELVGILFKAYIQERIAYNDFLRAAAILEKISVDDFKWFVQERKHYHFSIDQVGHLISSGLFDLHYEDINVQVKDKDQMAIAFYPNKGNGKYETDVDGGMDVSVSKTGEVILEVFVPGYQKTKPIII